MGEGDYAHFAGTDGSGQGGHKFGTGFPGQTEFPESLQTLEQLQAVHDEVVSNAVRVRLGTVGRYEMRALVGYEAAQMIVQVVLHADGSPNTIYPINGDGVFRNNRDGSGKIATPLNLEQLLGWAPC